MARARAPRPLDLGAVHVRPIRPPSKRAPEWYWRAVRYVNGREETVWTGRASREEAERTVAALVAGGLPQREPEPAEEPVRTVGDLLEVWLGSLEGKTIPSERTRAGYRRAAKHVKAGIGALVLDRLDADALDRYRDSRLAASAAPGTVGLELQVLRSAWRWGHGLGFCRTATMPRVRLPERRTYNDRTPTRGEVARVLAELTGWHRLPPPARI